MSEYDIISIPRWGNGLQKSLRVINDEGVTALFHALI